MNKNKIIKEVSFLWLGSILGALSAFALQVILARELGSQNFGLFASSLAFITLMVPIAGFGIAQSWLKVFGLEGMNALRWLKGSFRFLTLSALVSIILIVLWSFWEGNDASTKLILQVLILYLLGQVLLDLVSAQLQLEERFHVLAIWQLSPHIARLFLTLLIVGLTSKTISFFDVSIIYSFVGVTVFLTGFIILLKMDKYRFNLKGHIDSLESEKLSDSPNILNIFFQAWPFGLAAFFHLIYYQSDIILLKHMQGDHEAGIYSVAFSIMMAVYIFPSVIYQKYLLPKMHRWANHDTNKFYQVYKLGLKIMSASGMLVLIIVLLTSYWMIPLLFGQEYASSVLILNILAISIPMIYLAFNAGAILTTKDNMQKKVKYMGYTAFLNIVLNIVLIPIYSGVGAAMATVISNSALLYLYIMSVNKYIFSSQDYAEHTSPLSKIYE